MQKLYRYDPDSLKYLGFVLLMAGCSLGDPENYTSIAPEDESKLTDYTWNASTQSWLAVVQKISTENT